jgi:hypothetical protein
MPSFYHLLRVAKGKGGFLMGKIMEQKAAIPASAELRASQWIQQSNASFPFFFAIF